MAYFQTKNPNLGKFWLYLLAMEDVGIFCGHWVYFTAIWYILLFFPRFGTLYQEKSGNPESHSSL
jgi:hypothetical protein